MDAGAEALNGEKGGQSAVRFYGRSCVSRDIYLTGAATGGGVHTESN